MITASSKYVAALAYSHQSLARVTVDAVVAPVVACSLVCDGSRNVRRTATLTLASDPALPDLVPSITTASRVILEKGIRFLDGSEEYVTVATMNVQDITTTMDRSAVAMSLSDDGQYVDDLPLIYPWAPVSGGTAMTVVNAIKALVEDALTYTPTWSVDLDAGPLALVTADGTLYNAGTGRWAAVVELAKLIGAQVFPDPDNVWTIQQIRESVTPVYDFTTGPGGVLINATGKASRRDTYNGVAIEWGTTDVAGGIVLVTDSNAGSPTWWDGPWGRRVKPTSKLALTTEAAAIAAATADLAKSKGTQSGLGLTAVYNPLLVPGDVVGVTRPDTSREFHVIDSLKYDLTGGTMTADTRVVNAA